MPHENLSTRHEIAEGVRASVAAGLGMFPFGLAFGILIVQLGLPWWLAPLSTLVVYAGSSEMLLAALLTQGASLGTIALTTFFVNFRHVFYSFSFPVRVVRRRPARLYSMYAMTDEAYAITTSHPDGWTGARLIALEVALQSYWVGGATFGAIAGTFIPTNIRGLDFALCALFITLALDAARSLSTAPSLLLACVSFTLALVVTPGAIIFTALVVFAALLGLRYVVTGKGGRWPHA